MHVCGLLFFGILIAWVEMRIRNIRRPDHTMFTFYSTFRNHGSTLRLLHLCYELAKCSDFHARISTRTPGVNDCNGCIFESIPGSVNKITTLGFDFMRL